MDCYTNCKKEYGYSKWFVHILNEITIISVKLIRFPRCILYCLFFLLIRYIIILISFSFWINFKSKFFFKSLLHFMNQFMWFHMIELEYGKCIHYRLNRYCIILILKIKISFTMEPNIFLNETPCIFRVIWFNFFLIFSLWSFI